MTDALETDSQAANGTAMEAAEATAPADVDMEVNVDENVDVQPDSNENDNTAELAAEDNAVEDSEDENETTGSAKAEVEEVDHNNSNIEGNAEAEAKSPSSPQSKTEESEPAESKEREDQSPVNESGKKRASEDTSETKGGADDEPLPKLPLKKARTAYFIFADDKREELKQKHKGEGIAAIARATGQLWSALDPTQREEYETLAAEERLRVSRGMQRLKDAGLWPDPSNDAGAGAGSGAGGGGIGGGDDDVLIFPMARIRKICKLDPEVRGISKESALLITKATELFCVKLGNECVTMAQMQNRRKLLPEDVVEVCSLKERFLFLKDDMRDLAKEQLKEKKEGEKEKDGEDGKGKKGGGVMEGNVKTLESFFGKAR